MRLVPRRASLAQALAHPFLASLHDEEMEPSHTEPFETPDMDDDDLDWPTVRAMVLDEVRVWSVRNGRSAPPSVPHVAQASATENTATDALAGDGTDAPAIDLPAAASSLCKRNSSEGSSEADEEGSKRAKSEGPAGPPP